MADIYYDAGKNFIKALYDEYTTFFKNNGVNYFHMGFDEYTFRPELKIDFANEIYSYLSNKGFVVRMWSDAITNNNVDDLNSGIQITYWGWKNDDITQTEYATLPTLQSKSFKTIVTNKYYLFFAPSQATTTTEAMNFNINSINNSWDLSKWNYNYNSSLQNTNNILGGMITVWGEDSSGILFSTIYNHTSNMFTAMNSKLK